ncbi:Cerebellar degeneration-related antigen protein [Rutstroemia sp. NJR-2017a BBW]|nr:Cerebellar degeneration-related antigen protein [Rutstroemia sp. NJR-2017a BBW]
MSLLKTLTLLGLTASTFANPLPSLTPRDNGACYPQNMPIGQSDYNCPKKTTLDSSGHCSKPIPNVPGDAGCTAYCEIRVTAEYGQEVPIMDGSCQSGTTCSVSEGQSVTITNGYSINLGITGGAGSDLSKVLTASFNIGASYSWSKSVGYTTTETFSKTLDDKTCGYWTFIPYLMTSCGTLTTSPTGEIAAGYYMENEAPYCTKKSYTDTGNWCNTTPYKDANGHAEGKVLFVLTDCKTNAVLTTGQDPAYEYPGVSTGPKSK